MHARTLVRVAPLVPRLARGTGEARASADGGQPILSGYAAVFNRFAEIDSFEGHFLERVAPGAFRRSLAEDRDRIRLLYAHGRDPQVAEKPIGRLVTLRETPVGLYYEGALFDGVPELLMEGLRADQYGASFRFRVIADDWVDRPPASELNPSRLPERTLREVELFELGPVTWGAYPDASAGVVA